MYKQSTGYIKDGMHMITDNSWYKNILTINPCVDDCKYAPVCFGPCILNNTCYKNSIERLLPLFVEQKILQHKNKEMLK